MDPLWRPCVALKVPGKLDDLWEVKDGHLQTRVLLDKLVGQGARAACGKKRGLWTTLACLQRRSPGGTKSALSDMTSACALTGGQPVGRSLPSQTQGLGEWYWTKRWPEPGEQGGKRCTGNPRAGF